MSEKWAELSVAMDVWNSANPEVGEGRTVRLSSARCGGNERGASGDDVDSRSAGGGGRGRNGDEADGGSLWARVMSELLAVYRETPVMEETCIARKLDGNFCGVNVGKEGERGRFSLESAGVREAQGRSRAGALRGLF
jgi:hypothetical protein